MAKTILKTNRRLARRLEKNSSETAVIGDEFSGTAIAGGDTRKQRVEDKFIRDKFLTAPTTVVFDPGINVFTEDTGDITTLTRASVGDTVGTWADTSGTYTLRAVGGGMTLAEVDGVYTLQRTASGQYYTSDGAASEWTWLHNGTQISIASAWKFAGTGIWPVLATVGATSTQRGVAFFKDNRQTSETTTHTMRCMVTNGTLAQYVSNNTDVIGQSDGDWDQFVFMLRPTESANDRGEVYSFGMLYKTNVDPDSPSASAPTNTLSVCGLPGGALEDDYTEGYQGPIVIYQGLWSDAERKNVSEYLDYASRSHYEVLTATKNITNATVAYEAFPLLLDIGGKLVCYYRAGTTHASDKGAIAMVASDDNGATFSLPVDVFEDDTYDLRDPSGLVMSDGTVLLGTARYNFGGAVPVDGCNILISGDGGNTFSVRSTLSAPSGFDWIFPWGNWVELGGYVYGLFYASQTTTNDDYVQIWKTPDKGFTWEQVSQIGPGYNEASIINTTGSTWLCVMREESGGGTGLSIAVSNDDLQTWGSVTDTTLPGVSPHLFKVGDTVYCACGDRTSASIGMNIYVYSADGVLCGTNYGFKWESGTGGQDMGYPHSVVRDGQAVHMVWYDTGASAPTGTDGIHYTRLLMPTLNG